MLRPLWAFVVKILIVNGVLVALLVLSAFVTGTTDAKWVYITLVILGNVCFYMYDLLLDRFMIWYVLKLRKRLKF